MWTGIFRRALGCAAAVVLLAACASNAPDSQARERTAFDRYLKANNLVLPNAVDYREFEEECAKRGLLDAGEYLQSVNVKVQGSGDGRYLLRSELLRAAREITAFGGRAPARFDGGESLRRFLNIEMARAAGEMTMKYSQKRLGRAHFSMCKDENYARELVHCQTRLHAELLADAAHLFALRLGISGASDKWLALVRGVHREYVASAPQSYGAEACLEERHFNRAGDLGSMSARTGMFLFNAMPLTEDLLPGNARIFQGQVRAFYIRLTQEFDKRADKQKLAAEFG